jgi:hypothetical protein
MMDPVLNQLRDIRGLDPLPWWDLAPGWWALFAAVVISIIAGWLIYNFYPWGKWRADARRQLVRMRARVKTANPKLLVADLSELLRRIAMARYGREACAGLSGEAWLVWLRDRDPRGFDWEKEGRLLIELPYAPADSPVESKRLMNLVRAVWRWMETDARGPRKRKVKRKTRFAQWRKGEVSV